MNILSALILALIIVLAVDCTRAQTSEQKLYQIVLLDVQGLWGGRHLWISLDSNAVCRFVGPPKEGESGLQETRYEFAVPEEQLSSLFELITKHSFFLIRTKDRYGVPDEARPAIFVKSEAKFNAVGKWANDEHKDFDPIYKFLLKIAESGKKGKKTYQGTFDWNWKPDRFPENKSILDMTMPKVKKE